MFSFCALLSTALSGSYSQGLIQSFCGFPGNAGAEISPANLLVRLRNGDPQILGEEFSFAGFKDLAGRSDSWPKSSADAQALAVSRQNCRFGFSPAGKGVAASLDWLQLNLPRRKLEDDAPQEIVAKAWQRHITREDGSLDMGAYVFCTLDALRTALSRRDVFVSPSWRYADPRIGLLDGAKWLSARPIICRSLGLTIDAKTTLDALSAELDATWQAVATRLPDNPAIQLSENAEGKTELSLGALDKLEEPNSLLQLRAAVADLMPRVDLPEILLEIAARTGFSEAFIHVSERNARGDNLVTSLCAVLFWGGACNIGLEPLIRNDNQALRRDRLSWVSQNYLRDETLSAANAILVAAQSQLELVYFRENQRLGLSLVGRQNV
jgi:hypothetical protein